MPRGKKNKPSPLEHDKEICSICLEELDESCNCCLRLECSHGFHSDCLLEWYKKSNSEEIKLILPFDDLDHIHFFPTGTNTVKCPICNTCYTVELDLDPKTETVIPKNNALKRILGNVNVLHCTGKEDPIVITQYVTDLNTFKIFKFFCNIPDDITGEPITIHLRGNINDRAD
jgi:hypothetical protein